MTIKWWLFDRWERRALVTAMLLIAPHGGGTAADQVRSPRQAIADAAVERLGPGVVHVDVESLSTSVDGHEGLVAAPDPSGYVGRTARFALTVDGRRRGVALASVRVSARVAKVVRPIERGDLIDADAVAIVEAELDGVRFTRLPQLAEIVGARARRDLAPGVVITSGMVAALPAVVSGDRVTVGVTVGRVHVTGEGVASGSGEIGGIVHVMQPGRRGLLRVRVVERGVVEVVR